MVVRTTHQCALNRESLVRLLAVARRQRLALTVGEAMTDYDGRVKAFTAWGGIAGVQSTVELVLSERVARRRLRALRAPDVLARAAAERFRLPAKGRLEPGMDADVVLVRLGHERELERDTLLDRHRLSPYVGRTLLAEVRHTLRRGEVIYDDGRIRPGAGGRLIKP